ncbi:MAG: protein-export chaperone SecB [Clostridia bacterium]|nr:protein-export chaperone SecB [Clostridia bacterium]MBQ6467013.1 protein-export chaperone SecB [Clostridia bacterium]MBR5773177.1 protein-export chaperone SecB [Clostridia bacterium]MBR6334997.1 protein-export chaperone SecB [Clostridia bacterium]
MANVKMRYYKVSELTFVNKHENGAKLQFGNKISYNVRYSNTNVCVGQITAEAFDKENPDKFGVKIVLDGVFEYDTDIKKEAIHVETFKELYPFAKSIVSSVSVNAGVPQIILPPFDIESQSIYKFEKNV